MTIFQAATRPGLARWVIAAVAILLGACSAQGTSFSNRIGANGHDVLYSKARVADGVARFHCVASDSGICHYTLYPDSCGGKPDCALAPLQRFTVARGKARQMAGLREFRVCVAIDATPLRADCSPAAAR